MRNKIGKLFAFAIFGFLVSTLSVHALSYDITDSNSFDAMMDKYNETTQSVYVIGSYAFTTNHTLTTQDMMLSALSIDLSDYEGELIAPSDAYNKMTIFKLNREYDASDMPTGKWIVDTNFIGTDNLEDNKIVNIEYVDYEKVQANSSLEVSVEATEDMVNALEPYGYDVVLNNQENLKAEPTSSNSRIIMLSGKVYKLEDIENWKQEDKTGYYIAFEIKIPEQYKDKAQWWLKESDKKVHDGKNYIVRGIRQDADPKTFDVYVDFDGDGDEFEATRYVFDYSNIEFAAQASDAKISSETSDETVLGVLAEKLHINKADFVTIDDNNYVTGDIHYNPDVTVDDDQKTYYYIPVILEIDEKYVQKATYITENNNGPHQHTFLEKGDNEKKNIVAILFTVSPTDQNKTFKITVDLDGDGNDYEPKEYVYDYSKATFLAKPEATVSAEGKAENKETYADVMKNQFAYNGNQKTLNVAVAGDNVTLTGQLVNEKYKFNGKEQAEVDGYYFQYVIEISGDASHSSITIPAGEGKTKTFKYVNDGEYDFKDINGVSGIVVLHKLNNESEQKSFQVTVDLDGNGEADKTYTFDYQNLKLDNSSEVAVTVSKDSVEDDDKTTFEEWGFPKEAYDLTTVENNVVKGTLPYIENSKGFSGAEATGNFMIYTIELADVNTKGEAEVKLSCKTGSDCKDGWKIVKVDANKDLSVMHRVTQNEDGSLKDIVAYVDLDGFTNNPQDSVAGIALEPDKIYLPYEIRLTFDKGIVLQKKSEGHADVPEEMSEGAANGIKTSFSYEASKDQTATVKYSDNKITISGNVARDTSVTGFGDNASGYYVPFSLNFDQVYKDITIKMPENSNPATYENFDTDTEIGALFQLYPNSPETTAKITVDLDGDKTEYQPYDIIIDYENVKFLSNDMNVTALPATSKAGFEAWMQKKGYTGYSYKDTFAFAPGEDHRITVTGQSAKVTKGEQTEYHLIYFLTFDKKYDDIEVTIGSQVNKQSAFDGGSEGKFLTVNSVITQESPKEVKIKVDYDGEKGSVYEPTEYTLDLNGITFEN